MSYGSKRERIVSLWIVTILVFAQLTQFDIPLIGNGFNRIASAEGLGLGVKHEAENSVLSGGAKIATDHTGFSGSGFVDGYWSIGATSTYMVNVPSAGNYAVSMRYANGTGTAKSVSMYINGTKIKQTTLPSLADWDTWSNQVETIALHAGDNTIAFKYDSGDSGNVNLDYISFHAPVGNLTNVSLSGDTVNLSIGLNKMIIQILKPEILKVDYQPMGKSSPDTSVIDPNKVWTAGNIRSFDSAANPMVIRTSKMVVKISKNPVRISVYDSSGTSLLVKEQNRVGVYGGGVNFSHAAGENFYGINGYEVGINPSNGMLRNSGGLVRAGRQGDGGAPLAYTTKYGVLVDSDGGNFTINSSDLQYNNISKTNTKYYVILGGPKEIVKSVADISGKPPMSPKWALGFINSQWGSSETEITNIINTYRTKQIPIDGFTMDFDFKAWGEDNYGEWRWNSSNGSGNVHPNLFPNGASGQFASNMAAMGVKLQGIMKPRILYQNTKGGLTQAAADAQNNHYFYPGVQPYPEYFSGRLANDIDFANASARSWFWNHAKPLFDTGIVGWWNDEADANGNFFFNNFQNVNMQRAIYEGQRSDSNKRVWSINRNFYLGAQRYAYGMWSGDINTGFASMADQRTRMLSSINLGEAKWGMDTGGFYGTPSNENYARWMQFSAFVPIYRVHGTLGEKRQPWVYGKQAEGVAKKAIQLRYQLLPYMYTYDRQAYETGLGMVRPLFYDYPTDPNVVNRNDAWMFGDYMLAAPVVNQGQTSKSIYLPAGEWIDYFKGTQYKGGKTIQYAIDAATWKDIPLFVKKGAIIPNQKVMNYVDETPVQQVYVDTFPDRAQTSFTYYDDDGKTNAYETGAYFKQILTTQNMGNSVNFKVSAKTGTFTPALKSYIVKVHGSVGSKVITNDNAMKKYSSLSALENAVGEGYSLGKDVYGAVTYVKLAAGTSKNVEVISIYEAETAVLTGGAMVNSNHAGYSGSGFVAGYWNTGAATTFTQVVPTAGVYNLTLRFANATGASKTISLYVNGTKVKQTRLSNLANWDTWSNKVESVSLKAGSNTIAFKYESSDTGNVNLDYITTNLAP